MKDIDDLVQGLTIGFLIYLVIVVSAIAAKIV